MTDRKSRNESHSRRDFLKKGAYVVPSVLSLKAVPAFSMVGSGGMTVVDPPKPR